MVSLLIFISLGLTMGAAGPNLQQSAGPVTATGWFAGLIVVMFVYSGWNAAAYMAEEVRDPGRNLPLALALGTAAVTVIYLLINVLYLSVIPIGELVAVKGSVLDVAAERLLGARAGDVDGHRVDHQPRGRPQRMDVRRATCLFRDGSRRRVLSGGSAGSSDVQDAGRVDRRAGDLGDGAGADRQPRTR